MIDAAQESAAGRVQLGLINNNHYVSINKAKLDDNGDSLIAKSKQRVSEYDLNKSLIQSTAPKFDGDREADTSTIVSPPSCDNKTEDLEMTVIN